MSNVFSGVPHSAALRSVLLSGTALAGATLFGIACPTPASADQQFLKHGSLVISSSTYDNTKGDVAKLVAGTPQQPGTPLPNTKSATIPAVAGNDYVNVWNNESVDASFGVTSSIQLTDIDLSNYKIFRSIQVPTDQVVTSFSSKSELGLHVRNNWPSVSVVFMGYGAPRKQSAMAPRPQWALESSTYRIPMLCRDRIRRTR